MYQGKKGRELLKVMAENQEEEVKALYDFLKEYYPYLIDQERLSRGDIHRYNSLVASNISNIRVRKEIQITEREQK